MASAPLIVTSAIHRQADTPTPMWAAANGFNDKSLVVSGLLTLARGTRR